MLRPKIQRCKDKRFISESASLNDKIFTLGLGKFVHMKPTTLESMTDEIKVCVPPVCQEEVAPYTLLVKFVLLSY